MLKTISIKNYILIENIKIDFDNCFSVLTGETGAGKSIIIEAISLILGKRIDSSVLYDKTKKCIVEAYFNIDEKKYKNFFVENDVDYEQITIVRREINSIGKSRAFINDTPVSVNTIKSFVENLVDLHSQHQNLKLNDYKYRIGLIDSIAGTVDLYYQYLIEFSKYSNFKTKLNDYRNKFNSAVEETDYCKFQVEQIKALNITDTNELDELENKASILENAEEIKKNLYNSYIILCENDNSIETNLKTIKNYFNSIAKSYKNSDKFLSRIESVLIEIKDISNEINYEEKLIEINQSLLDEVNTRIDAINTILKKHNCKNIQDLFEVYNNYENRISSTKEIEEKLTEYIKLTEKQEIIILDLANKLTQKRQKSFNNIEKIIISTLKDLGMPNSKFVIKNNISNVPTETGFDNIEFLFTANKNTEPKLLEKIASGGELSRLMLTIKSMLAKGLNLATVIFDEIDTGVSGEIADKMAVLMQSIAKERQVICITHLPQVAAKGQDHYKIIKDETGTHTKIYVIKLVANDRINEIASMISGAKITLQSIENAKALLSEKILN